MNYNSKHGVDDMTLLSKISEDGILDNLKKRYEHDMIYTYIGHVLISVNPFRLIKGLYDERTLKDYRGKYPYELPPHVYALSDNLYREMLMEGDSQCVIISGESGAGKTEASKVIMQYIAAVSGKSAEVVRVKDIILDSNPLLEAFGNAKTIRNNNSSRFGKYMEIQFDMKGDPEGGRITNYLLEKSRVVFQSQNERTFHVFYQLLAGAPSNYKTDFRLGRPEQYRYLSNSGCYTVDGVNDAQEFADTVKAMTTIGITSDQQYEIFRLLAAILYLGNIDFTPNEKDEAMVADPSTLEMFAYLFQADVRSCEQALLYRTIQTGTGVGKKGSVYSVPQNVAEAYYSRDALAKTLYSRMFDWIIEAINRGLFINDPESMVIGVLDIYGFEIFAKNGFEQFCINFVNEKLQQIFIDLTLRAEQDEYQKEGIKWEPIQYFNNKICCDLVESKKPVGILAILDDVCNFPKGTDEKFLGKLHEAFSQHAHFGAGQAANQFVIKHYAGDVQYDSDGFCDKNRDLLFNDLIDLAQCTSSQFIVGLFPEVRTAADKRRPTTAGFKIKESIGVLVNALSRCTPHYIRCIKPNDKKQANNFDNSLVMHQVKYLGLLENVRIRRAGFAYRHTYEKFFYRYRVCSAKTWPTWNGDFVAGTEAIIESLHLEPGQWQKGATKVFIRLPETVFGLEEMRERKVASFANRIQRFLGQFTQKQYFYDLQTNANNAVRGKKERRRNSLNRTFVGDYANYRENFTLKAAIKSAAGGEEERMLFADNVHKVSKAFKRYRRGFLISERAAYLVEIDKNPTKDKAEKKTKPWVYVVKRRVPLTNIKGVSMSTMQDNMICMHVSGDYDLFLDAKRKTEILGFLLKLIPALNVSISDSFSVMCKKQKTILVQFVRDETCGDGKIKSKKVHVASGQPRDSAPQLRQPPKMPQIAAQAQESRGVIVKKNPSKPSAPPASKPAPMHGGGGPAQNTVASAGKALPAKPAPKGPTPPAGGGGGPPKLMAKALYDFTAENPDELNFQEGAMVEVLDRSQGDWWYGLVNGAKGLFPANYVEIQQAAAPPPAAKPPPPSGPPPGQQQQPYSAVASKPKPQPPMGGPPKGKPAPPSNGAPPAGAKPQPQPQPPIGKGAPKPGPPTAAGAPGGRALPNTGGGPPPPGAGAPAYGKPQPPAGGGGAPKPSPGRVKPTMNIANPGGMPGKMPVLPGAGRGRGQ